MVSELAQGGEGFAGPILLTQHAFMSLTEIERKGMLSSVVIVKDHDVTTLVREKHTQIVDHSRHDTIPMWVKFDEKFDRSNLMKL